MKHFFLFFAGRKAALMSMGCLILFSLGVGLLAQTPRFLWILLGISICFLLICLVASICKRLLKFRLGARDIGFMLTHIGLFLSLFFLGLSQWSEQRIYMPLYEGQTSNQAYNAKGYVYQLPFTLHLDSFNIDYYTNEQVKAYTSWVSVQRANHTEIKTQIKVNKPFTLSEWMIYQYSYRPAQDGQPALSQLMLVRDIWTWFIYVGLILFVGGNIFLFSSKGGKTC
ncbi:MAG: cytochrome c biogenesis protein ResB [Bacteroidales bacterium]